MALLPYPDADGLKPDFPKPMRKNDDMFLRGAEAAKPFVHAYVQTDTEVVCGPSCVVERDIHADRCRADGIAIVKRRGGGGTVVLSEGMVITLVVGKRGQGQGALHIFSNIHDAMMDLLDPHGPLRIHKAGLSDCAIGGRKILGSSLYLQSDPFFYYYQSALMVSSNVSLIEKYLKHPPKEPDYRKGREHALFCTTLSAQGFGLSAAAIAAVFSEKLPFLL